MAGYISLKNPEEINRLKILRKLEVHIFEDEVVPIVYLGCGDKALPNYLIFVGIVFTDDFYGVKISHVLEGEINIGMYWKINCVEVHTVNELYE